MKIIVIGYGSIGKKHCDNLGFLGVEYDVCDLVYPNAKYKDIYEVGFNEGRYDLAIICTPTEDHLEHIHCLNDRGFKYIMCEKPLYHYPTGNQIVMDAGLQITMRPLESEVFINHAYRFERGINKLKELVEQGIAGEIDHVFMENWYLFEKMHPHYNKEEFLGVIYDDSHLINTSRYLWGEPQTIKYKDITKMKASWDWITDRGIEVCHTTIETSTRYKKRIEVIGNKGNLIYNFKAHEIFFAPSDESERAAIPYKHADHLMESLKYVLKTVASGEQFTENTIWDAQKDMTIIEELIK